MDKKSNNLRKKVFEAYSNKVLEHEKEPQSVYLFCKELEIEEKEFYKQFSSLAQVKKEIFCAFFDNTYTLISKEKNFASQRPQEKLLAFYYTFFEVLLLNRSFVLFLLGSSKDRMEKLGSLSGLRNSFKKFTAGLIQDGNAVKQSRFTRHPEGVFSEGAWLQLLFILKFWMEDTSPGFEKTDMAIEKSVRTVFDLFDNTPVDSIIDFGKFLWKEKFNMI